MRKKSLVLLLAFVLGCSMLTGCGDKAEKKEDKKTEESGDKAQSEDGEEKIPVKDLSEATVEEAWEYCDEIVKTIQEKEPVFGEYEVSIADFGAVEGEVDKANERERAIANTKAIYEAICDVNKQKEGGTVKVPAGTWYTGPVHLKSNVNLCVEEGAVLKFATDTDLYAGELTKELYGSELTFVRNNGVELYNYSPFIYAKDCDNIALSGKGSIDGQAGGEYWSKWKTLGEQVAVNNLFMQGETNVPVEEREYGESEGEIGTATDGYIRPNFVVFVNCDQVLIEDVTILNTPAWQLHPIYCNYVTIRGVNISSPTTPNSDGIDPDSCKYVLIDGNTFNTGDDCIAIKSGKNEDGRRVNISSENIVIQNNKMEIGHGGVTLGSEASAGIRNVFARDNQMGNSAEECCFRFKNSTLRGNLFENCYYKNTQVPAFKATSEMILFESDYGVESETEYLKSVGIEPKYYKPVTRNIYIDGFYATPEKEVNRMATVAIKMTGVEDSPITNVHFSNFEIQQADTVMELEWVDGLTVENLTAKMGKEKDTFENCKNITFKNVSILESKKSEESDYAGIENFVSENFTVEKQSGGRRGSAE